MTPQDIEQMKADREAGTPDLGGWGWYGCGENVYLATHRGGRRFIMDFVRKGFNRAQPRFQIGGVMYGAVDSLVEYEVGDGAARGLAQAKSDRSVYRFDIRAIDHPDARRMTRIPDMEAEILRLREALEETTDICSQCLSGTILIRGQYVDTEEAVSRARAVLNGDAP